MTSLRLGPRACVGKLTPDSVQVLLGSQRNAKKKKGGEGNWGASKEGEGKEKKSRLKCGKTLGKAAFLKKKLYLLPFTGCGLSVGSYFFKAQMNNYLTDLDLFLSIWLRTY